MAETKDEIAAERDQLREENNRLKAQLAAAGQQASRPGAQAPQHLFLSEGDRQELETTGRVNLGGRLMNAEQVRAELAGGPQAGVEIAEPKHPVQVPADQPEQPPIRGFNYVYPSVAPGRIDPAVAGTPGINGPAADVEPKR